MALVDEIQTTPSLNGLASVLAIGIANPPNEIYQSDYPDFYFRHTNSEHMIDIKEKFKHICEKSTIKKRYMHISEAILKQNPKMCDNDASCLETRHVLQVAELPKVANEAAMKAIQEWGQSKSNITHLIFCTTSPVDIPGPDYHLTRLLDLSPSVKRYMLPQQGCHAGAASLRLAKDLAENNRGARVLVVCSENNIMYFHAPSESNRTSLLAPALFGDGAAAVIVGANPDKSSCERPIFQLVSSSQTILPNTQGALELHLRKGGVNMEVTMSLKELISKNIDKVMVEAFNPLGINDWNSIFWICHPGTSSILGQIESKLGLDECKLSTARHVMSEFGHMTSATVLFVMDEMRKSSFKQGKATTGDGLDWGVLFGFGPGFTVDTIVLRSFPIP